MNSPTMPAPTADAPASPPTPAPQPPAPARKPPTLKQKAMRGGMWAMFGHGSVQGLRFVSNILLAAVLVPADFGLMQLITMILSGLAMFSDIGIGPAVIQNHRQDARFLNTAWTMQTLRGLALWAVAAAAAVPLSWAWPDAAALKYMLPVAGVFCFINGFQSTNWFTANRNLAVRGMILVEVVSYVIQIAVAVTLVYTILPNAWALVVSMIVYAICHTVGSHLIPGIRNRFDWDPVAARDMFHFGKWLFLSTVVTFFASQIDSIMLQSYLGVATLGLYGIGRNLSNLAPDLSRKLGTLVGFPVLAEVHRTRPQDFSRQLLRVRKALTVPIHVALLVMIALGPSLFYLCYRPKYWDAGWIVQALCVNSLAGMLNTSYGKAYVATGRPKLNLYTVLGQLFTVTAGALVGYYLGGYYGDAETGFILGVTFSQWLKYPIDMVLVQRIGCWHWKFDLFILVTATMGAVLMLYVADWIAPYSIAAGEDFRAWASATKDSIKAAMGWGS